MRTGFDYPHDEDRFDRDDQPRQVPMRPGGGQRRNLTTDEKKVKHRLNRQGGLDAEAGGAMNDHQREAQLLQALAVATPAEQAQLAAELDNLRSRRREAARADRETDLADTIVRDTLTPVVAYSRHTASTDWVGEVTDDSEPGDVHQEMLTEATLWFQRVHPLVRADREEFAAQAMGMAQRLASQHGRLAPAAQRAFLDHVGHLHGRLEASGGLSVAAEAGWGDTEVEVELPADVPDELAFEGAVVTAADGEGLKDWSDKDSTGGDNHSNAATTDPKTIHDQSGYGVSGLPQDKPIANETMPDWAEDWKGYKGDGYHDNVEELDWADKKSIEWKKTHGSSQSEYEYQLGAEHARLRHPRKPNGSPSYDRGYDSFNGNPESGYGPKMAADTGNNASDRNNSHGQVPEEIEKLDDPDERPMWPWGMSSNDEEIAENSGASDVAGTHTPGQGVGDYPQPKKSKLDAFRQYVAASRGAQS